MKRANNLIESIADIDNLRLAFWKARIGKSYSSEVAKYRLNLDANLLLLRHQILTNTIEVGKYRFFKIYDPKERQICAGAFKEQVLHHALMNICHDYFERVQIFDSYASRKGKGTYAAIERAKRYTKRYRYFLKLDVKKFFASIHHVVLKGQLEKLFKDYELLSMFAKIIDSYEAQPERGVPIGNLTSQYFANHFLAGLDHFVKETLQVKAYVRYMDDMILWQEDKKVLKKTHQAIQNYITTKLQVELKPILLNYSSRGLPFLGYLIFPYHVRLTQRSKKRFIRKMNLLQEKYNSGEWDEATCQRHALPLIAFTNHATTNSFRKRILFS